ncbi:MAG: exo-alpha-sialidase, partial [Methylotenera sp.]
MTSMKKIFFLALSALVCFTLSAQAHEEHTQHQSSNLAVSVAFDADANLWRVRAKDDFVLVDMSRDLGKRFTKPMAINAIAQKIAADGEARPKIAIGPEGNIYLTWTEALKTPFSGYVWFVRSIN